MNPTIPPIDPLSLIIIVVSTFATFGIILLIHRRCYWCDTRTYFKKVCKEHLIGLAIISLLLVVIVVPNVYANHLWTGHKWTRVNTLIYYCVQPDMSSLYHGEITKAANDINGWVGQFTLKEKTWDANCVNHISVASMSPNFLAYYEMYYYDNGAIKSADIKISSTYKFDNAPCDNIQPFSLRNLMHHEFAHWMEGHHPSTETEITVLVHTYDCAKWNSFKSHDIASFNSIYPTTTSTSSLRAMEAGDTDEDAIKAGAKKGPSHKGIDLVPQIQDRNDKDKHELSDSQQKTFDKIMKQRGH